MNGVRQRRSLGAFLSVCVVFGAVLLAAQLAHAQADKTVLVAARYQPPAGRAQPLVTPRMRELGLSLQRLWSGQVLDGAQSAEAVEGAWVLSISPQTLERIGQVVPAAKERFLMTGAEAAINPLESLLGEADELLPAISTSPSHAQMLLDAHLLLWQGLAAEDPSSVRLTALMGAAARRFPTAVVDTQQWPPDVVEAFSQAQQEMVGQKASLTFRLSQGTAQDCRLFVNGLDYGDGRGGGVAVARGATYHIGLRCDGLPMTPPRKVTTDGHETIELDGVLVRQLALTSAGATLTLSQGPDGVADAVFHASALGRSLGATDVVLAGVFEDEQRRMILQLDRVHVATSVRVCSVRILLDQASAWDIDKAIHTLHLQKPTASAPLSFASDDNIYRSVDEYIQWAGSDGSYPLTWTFSTLAAGALVGGVALEWMTASKRDELTQCIANTSCRSSPQIHELRSEADDLGSIRTGLFVGSAVLALGAVGFYFLESPDNTAVLAPDPPQRAGDVILTPVLGAGHLGLEFNLVFE